ALGHGDRVLVRRSASRLPQRGEVAVLRRSRPNAGAPVRRGHPSWPGRGRLAIKRVAALPGDAVPESVRTVVGGAVVVPDGMLVLLGDNPRASHDSRSWGFVPAADVLGKVVTKMPGTPGPASQPGTRRRPAEPSSIARHVAQGSPSWPG